jgi:hypothetical protein
MNTVTSSSNPMELSIKPGLLERVSGSVKAWLTLVAYLLAVKFILMFLPPLNVKIVASEFAWSTIAVFGVIGFVGVLLSMLTGFPDALDKSISNRQRILSPITLGASLGIFAIIIDQFTHGAKFLEMQSGEASFNIYFPASLFVYTGGIVLVEAVFRIFAIPLFLWLISTLILRGRGQNPTFWILAVILSLFEPVTQGLGIIFLKPSADPLMLLLTQFLPYFVTNYPLNLGQAIFFRKYGFLASFAMRFGFYMMWHVVYGNFIYPALG